MKRMLQLIKPHWRALALASLCSLVVSGVNGLMAWAVKYAVDDVFIRGDKLYLVGLSVAVLISFVIRGTFMFAQNFLMASIGGKIVRDIRITLYEHMVYLPMTHYGSDTAGSMMSRVINDAGMLDKLMVTRIRDLFVNAFTVVALTAIAFYRRWDLTLIAVVVLPLAFAGVDRIGRRLKAVSRKAQEKIARITEYLSEGLSGIKVVKAFGMEKREVARFRDRSQDYYREYMRSNRLMEAAALVMELVAGVGIFIIVYYGGQLVVSKEMTTGDFFSFIAAILMIYAPAKKLAQVQNGLQQAAVYVERIDEVLHIAREAEGQREALPLQREIVFEDVTFRYPGREEDALKGLNLIIRKGEVLALVGRSGAGKTTLVDLLCRFYQPQRGRILYDGVDIREFTSKSLRAQLGLVSQNVILFNDTVGENIRFGKPAAEQPLVEAAARAAFAHDFITELPEGYDTPVGDAGSLLSGGQRQRLSIARAMLKDPPLLVMDEATSSLDTQSERMVQSALDGIIHKAEEASDEGASAKTIIVIAHRLSTIKRADRIVVLAGGSVAESGSHEELIARGGLYRKLYELQFSDQDSDAGPQDIL